MATKNKGKSAEDEGGMRQIDTLSTGDVGALETSDLSELSAEQIQPQTQVATGAALAPESPVSENVVLTLKIDASEMKDVIREMVHSAYSDEIQAAARAALAAGDHPAYAALDDLMQLIHTLKMKAAAASAVLEGDTADLVAKLQLL